VDVALLSSISLPDSTGTARRLGDLWREQETVLVFLRHFG
jgi:hypothetical protein